MSTILIDTSPARGHLDPMMDVALAMRDAGHRVVVQTLAAERERVTAEGVEHRPIAPAIEALTLDDYRQGSPMRQLRAAFACWLARAPHEVDDLRAASAEVDPDLLLVDANTWGAAAGRLRRPVPASGRAALPHGGAVRVRQAAVARRHTPSGRDCGRPPARRPNGSRSCRDPACWSACPPSCRRTERSSKRR